MSRGPPNSSVRISSRIPLALDVDLRLLIGPVGIVAVESPHGLAPGDFDVSGIFTFQRQIAVQIIQYHASHAPLLAEQRLTRFR